MRSPLPVLAVAAAVALLVHADVPSSHAAETPKPAPPAQSATNRWDRELAEFTRADQVNPPPPSPVLFVGSSSIRLWSDLAAVFPDRPLLNRGFGGSHFSDLNEHFDRLVAKYRPSVILVYEGDNDLAGGKSVERVVADFEAFRAKVRNAVPGARCAYLAIKPSPSRTAHFEDQREANRRIQELVRNDPQWTVLDTFSAVLGSDQRPDPACFLKDQLHLNAEGYRRWKGVVGPWLEKVAPKWQVSPAGAAARP